MPFIVILSLVWAFLIVAGVREHFKSKHNSATVEDEKQTCRSVSSSPPSHSGLTPQQHFELLDHEEEILKSKRHQLGEFQFQNQLAVFRKYKEEIFKRGF